MNTFFKLIDKTSDTRKNFDVERYNKIVETFDIGEYDDFITYFAFFLYEFPLPKNLEKIFDKKNLNGKLGIACRHLIKTAKSLNVDQNLIDYYFDLKKNKNWHKKLLQYSEDDIKTTNWSEDKEGNFDIDRYTHYIQRHESNKEGYLIYRHQFNRITFLLIQSILESK